MPKKKNGLLLGMLFLNFTLIIQVRLLKIEQLGKQAE